MKKEFPGYFVGGDLDLESIWDNCIFVLDANVLLNLYRYSDSTSSELLNVFDGVGDRLWVPNQVVGEYLSNRLGVIAEQAKIYDDYIKKLDVLKRGLESVNQHPFVSVETLEQCVQLFDKVVLELNSNKSIHEKRIFSDEIKKRLETLLDGKVGGCFDRARLEKTIADGKVRYEQKIPPGFCDAKKGGDSIVFSEMCKPYGDYIVWLQMIDKALEVVRPIIFVTGDTKDDWWSSFQGKTLGPHPQLIQEFLDLTGQNFYMYPPDRFLERASTYLKQVASQKAVDEIREVRIDGIDNSVKHHVERYSDSEDSALSDKARYYASRDEAFDDAESELHTIRMRVGFLKSEIKDIRGGLKSMHTHRKILQEQEPSEDVFQALRVLNKRIKDFERRTAALESELDHLFVAAEHLVQSQENFNSNMLMGIRSPAS